MAQCQAVTRLGLRCRREALPGSPYCATHQRRIPACILAPTMLGRPTRRVRYLGRAPFLVEGALFTPEAPLQDLPEEQALYLTGRLPALFRLEE